MALRRLQGVVEGRSGEHGVAVLMRYTLRLLTIQQFQRATALICACEAIRREDRAHWGKTPFRIGLWVGRRRRRTRPSKPTRGFRRRGAAVEAERCGRRLAGSTDELPVVRQRDRARTHIKVETMGSGRGRTLIYCGDPLGHCLFSRRQSPGEGLPVVVVDEEIYRRLPTLLIATVDKFAQMPWNGEVQMLFGQVNGFCERHGFRSPEVEDATSHPRSEGVGRRQERRATRPLRPPDLIIQDELHLISGPLGTLVGLYETAVDELCSWEVDGKRVRPKVIASTATIRKAPAQVHSLFLRKVDVFPPPGFDVRDNFFSLQQRAERAHAGRRYIGICAPGERLKAALIRVYVAFLGAAQVALREQGTARPPTRG